MNRGSRVESVQEPGAAELGDAREGLGSAVITENRGGLEQPCGLAGKCNETLGDDLADAFGYSPRCRVTCLLCEIPTFVFKVPNQLLDEERVARGLLEDRVEHCTRGIDPAHAMQEQLRLVEGKPEQMYSRVKTLPAELGQSVEDRTIRRHLSAPIRAHREQRRAR